MSMDSRDSVSRVSSLRSRPSFTPLGPRTPSRPTFEQQSHPSSAASRASSPRVPSPSYSTHTSPVISEPRVLPTLPETLLEVQTPSSPGTDTLPPAYSVLPETQPESPRPPPSPSRIPAPPEMRFEHQSVEWKALPLEAALCKCPLCSITS